jgi:hypothetical protein
MEEKIMKSKIVSICICMLIIATIAFPAVATQNKVERIGQFEYEPLENIDERPVICIDSISGGRAIKAVLKNVGSGYASYVNWAIDIEGGFILGETHFEGVFEDGMGFEDEIEIHTRPIRGLGLVKVNISCEYPYMEENRSTIKWKYWNTPTYLILLFYSYPPKILNPYFYNIKPSHGWVPVDQWQYVGEPHFIIQWTHDALVGWYDIRCVDKFGSPPPEHWRDFRKWGGAFGAHPGILLQQILDYEAVFIPLMDAVNAGTAEWQVFIP